MAVATFGADGVMVAHRQRFFVQPMEPLIEAWVRFPPAPVVAGNAGHRIPAPGELLRVEVSAKVVETIKGD